MSDGNQSSLKEVIDRMIRAYGLGDRLDEVALLKSWEDVVGKMIAKHTVDLWLKDKVLHVKLDSSTVRQELAYAKTALIEKLNRKAGKTMLQDIIFK